MSSTNWKLRCQVGARRWRQPRAQSSRSGRDLRARTLVSCCTRFFNFTWILRCLCASLRLRERSLKEELIFIAMIASGLRRTGLHLPSRAEKYCRHCTDIWDMWVGVSPPGLFAKGPTEDTHLIPKQIIWHQQQFNFNLTWCPIWSSELLLVLVEKRERKKKSSSPFHANYHFSTWHAAAAAHDILSFPLNLFWCGILFAGSQTCRWLICTSSLSTSFW